MSSLIIVAFLISMPFYLFSSGSPQISTILLGLLILFNMTKIIITFSQKISYIYILLFLYILLINIFYYYYSQNYGFLITNLFYVLNITVMTVIFPLFNNKRVIKAMLYGSVISLSIQFGLSFFVSGSYSTYRSTIFFNNPNQLASYAVFITALALLLNNFYKKNKVLDIYVLFLGLYLTFLSSSKAGLASCLVMLILYFILTDYRRYLKILSYIFSLLSVILTILIFTDNKNLYGISPQLDYIMNRFNNNPNHEQGILTERGYDRILENPEYLVFGAGEGMHQRFGSGMELHSIFGTILFSYGIIGFSLFLILLIFIFIKLRFRMSYVLIAPLLYGITHQSLRSTLFWILIALLIYGIKNQYIDKTQKEISV